MRRTWFAVFAGAFMFPTIAWGVPATKASAAHAVAQAKAKIEVAASLNDQWIPTIAAFKAAKAAEQKGDFAAAQAKAMRAHTLADLSIQQAIAQKKLWVNEVVH